MRRKLITVIVLMVVSVVLFSGCSIKQPGLSNNTNNNENQSIKGDPLSVVSTAIKDLNYSTNFDAQKTVIVKINSKETRAIVFNFITNSSSLFTISKTELKNGASNIIFKRVHLKNVQYELNTENNQWDIISRDKSPSMFMYSYYKLNRRFTMDILNEIYSEDKNQFGDFFKNAKKVGTETVNGYNSTVYSYSYSKEDSKRTINRNGKIYVSEVNAKPFVVKVLDDNFVTFKSNKTTVENVTNLEIKNIGNATQVTQKK